MAKLVGTVLALLLGLGISAAQAGFRSPESLVRNVYAYYGDRSSDLSRGLPRDTATARTVLRPEPAQRMAACENQPYDFLVQSPSWKLGAVSISILRKQFDKTYVAVAFDNQRPSGHAEFHRDRWPRRLGNPRRREPARFLADVSGAVQELERELMSAPQMRIVSRQMSDRIDALLTSNPAAGSRMPVSRQSGNEETRSERQLPDRPTYSI